MTVPVPPGLEERFTAPALWQWDRFVNRDGKSLRFGYAVPERPKAHIVLLPGRTEFIEKYFETMRDLLARNLAVWIMDWQGQGKSDRESFFPERGHTPPFETHARDLYEFVMGCIEPVRMKNPAPLVMLAHSMGANIGLRVLADHPGLFKAAALSAPLLGIRAIRLLPPVIESSLVWFLKSLFGRSYAFGQKDWHREERQVLGKALTSDPVRSRVHDLWMDFDPALRLGGVTFGWLYESCLSCRMLTRSIPLEKIRIPVLVALAENEILVDNQAIRKMARRLPEIRLLELPGAGHEILMERDEIRTRFLSAFDETLRDL